MLRKASLAKLHALMITYICFKLRPFQAPIETQHFHLIKCMVFFEAIWNWPLLKMKKVVIMKLSLLESDLTV